MGRPAVTAGESGARWWATAAQVQREIRTETLDHADFYDLAGELAATLRSLEDLADTLARQVGRYGSGRDLRDDAGCNPRARLMRAVTEASSLRIDLAAAVGDSERFWSAIGHIGLELPPEEQGDEEEPADNASDGPVRKGESS